MAQFIVINSDLDPISYPIDTEEEIAEARQALRDAGLEHEDVWFGEPDCPDAYKSAHKLFAARD